MRYILHLALVIAKLLRSEISEGYKAHMVIIVRGFQPVAACSPYNSTQVYSPDLLRGCLLAQDLSTQVDTPHLFRGYLRT